MNYCKTTQYAKDVMDGKVNTCRYVKLACQRHLNDLERINIDPNFKFVFRKDLAEKFFKFCSYLKHYKGPVKNKRFELEDWQYFIFGNMYGWVDENENWRYKQVYIEVPRKNGKTTMAAACALYDAALVERTGAEVYCVATKEDQAKLLYNDCLAYINQSPELQDVFEVLTGRSIVYVKDTMRSSWVVPVGSDSKRLDGLNPCSVIADEVHAWQKPDLWHVFADSFGARTNYHMIAITTAGYNRNSICYEERDHLTRILEGSIKSDTKFGVIYTVDDKFKDDWKNPDVWYMANPNLDVGKQIEFMDQQAKKVQQIPTQLNAFLNKQLNIWTDVSECFISAEDWNKCAAEIDLKDLIGKDCYAGMDLARVNDLSAVAYFFPEQSGLELPVLIVDFFLPGDDIKIKEDSDRLPYESWSKHHNLTLTPGKTTDWDFILESIREKNGLYNIIEFGYDRHFAGELVNALEKEKIQLKKFGMGFISMGSPTAELERLVIAKGFKHTGCPILTNNIQSTIVVRDAIGNLKPNKLKSTNKIDGVVAAVVAIGTYLEQPKKKTAPYRDRGLRVL